MPSEYGDARSCPSQFQLASHLFVLLNVKVLLRSGKRYNPDEIQRKKDSAAARVNKEVKVRTSASIKEDPDDMTF